MTDRKYGTAILRDGVGAVRAIQLAERFQNIGVNLVRNVVVETSDAVGDGTTAAAVILDVLVSEGHKAVAGGIDPRHLAEALDLAGTAVLERLASMARPLAGEEMVAVARLAANGDEEIASLIAEALAQCGPDGLLSVTLGSTQETRLLSQAGLAVAAAPLPQFRYRPGADGRIQSANALVLCHDGILTSFDDLTPVLETVLAEDRPLVVVAEDIVGDALAGLVQNHSKNILNVLALKLGRGESMDDIAAFCGAQVLGAMTGKLLKHCELSDLGALGLILCQGSEAVLIEGDGGSTAAPHREALAFAAANLPDGRERDGLQQRHARLSGRAVTLEVGGVSDLEIKERRDRIDIAARATRSAMASGILPGGGIALIDASDVLDRPSGDVATAAAVAALRRALAAPAKTILQNAGQDPARLAGPRQAGFGINPETGAMDDFGAAGILDSHAVVATALDKALSCARLVIGSEVFVLTSAPRPL